MRLRLSNPGNRLFLGCFIEDAPIGQPFPRVNWPLHITLVPWFLCGLPDKLDMELARALAGLQQFDVRVGDETMFGSKKNMRVNLIEPNDQLSKLHQILLGKVRQLGQLDTDEQFTGEGYRAHITHVRDRFRSSGDKVRIDSIHLTELTDPGHCTPLKRYGINP
jgi:2'-5' RNA ligase